MIRLDPLQAIKVAIFGGLLIYGWYIFDSRADAFQTIKTLEAQVAAHEMAARAAAADADRKTAAYTEAKRKADNEAKDLRGRIAWLKSQTGKSCEDAGRIIREYRSRK